MPYIDIRRLLPILFAMPSPIAHSATGYVLARFWFQRVRPQPRLSSPKSLQPLVSFTAIYTLIVANFPDLDFVPQILTGERFHRGPTHSIFIALLVSLLLAWIANRWQRRSSTGSLYSYKALLCFTLALYTSHLSLDLITAGGRGMQLFWPLSTQYFQAPFSLFPGVHHSRGLWDASHFVFITAETLYSICIVAALNVFRDRTSPNH